MGTRNHYDTREDLSAYGLTPVNILIATAYSLQTHNLECSFGEFSLTI